MKKVLGVALALALTVYVSPSDALQAKPTAGKKRAKAVKAEAPAPALAPIPDGFQELSPPAPPGASPSPADLSIMRRDLFRARMEISRHLRGTAHVSPDSSGYSLAATDFGLLPVVYDKLEPFLDGYKLTVLIGNPTTARITGYKVSASWGPPYPENPTEAQSDAWVKAQKEKEFNLTTVLEPGAYTTIELPLTPAKADEVKGVDLGISVNMISLPGKR